MLFEQVKPGSHLTIRSNHKTTRERSYLSRVDAAVLLLCMTAFYSGFASAQDEIPARTFGDWVVNCSEQENGKIGCGMSQVAVYENTAERLLRIDLRYIPSTQVATVQFIMPLGVSLEFPPQLFVEGAFSAEVPLNYCMPDGCYSTFVLRPQVLEKILAMEKGNIQLQAANGHMMSLPISGKGSREAFNAIASSATD